MRRSDLNKNDRSGRGVAPEATAVLENHLTEIIATIEKLSDVQWPTLDHLYWPQLDVDLSVASIRDPSAFPLVSRHAG